MANIRTNQDLLKLLYNLKSDDSCIKNELATKKESLISEKDDCTKKLTEESESLSELNSNQKAVEVGPNEAEKWLGEFDENKDLQRLFGLMEVDFDISVIREKILKAEDIDALKERINSDISRTTNEIESLRKQIEDNGIKAEEIEEQIADYERARHELGRIISDVLGGAETYTRNYIGDILRKISSFSEKYALSENEIATVSKLILFPEEELKQFNDLVLQGQVDFNIVSEVVETEPTPVEETASLAEPVSPIVEESTNVGIFADQVANEEKKETEPTELAPKTGIVIEESTPEESPFITFEQTQTISEEPVKVEESSKAAEISEESKEEPIQEESKDDIKPSAQDIYGGFNTDIIPIVEVEEEKQDKTDDEEFFANLSLDPNNFIQKEQAIKILKACDVEVIRRNLEELKALGTPEENIYFIKDSYVLLADKELPSKINLFRSKGIKEDSIKDIILITYALISLPLSTMQSNIAMIEGQNGVIDNSNYLLISNPEAYYNALKDSEKYDITFDEKQRKYIEPALLEATQDSIGVNEVLKEYGISAGRRNGKNEIDIYFKTPTELEESIDSLIEIGAEEVLRTTPEIMSVETDQMLKKIKYLTAKGESYVDESGYCKKIAYIPAEFQTTYPEVTLPEITSRKENNEILSKEGSKYNAIIPILIESLNNYYTNNADSYKTIKIDDPEVQAMLDTIKHELESESSLENVDKNTYKLNDEYLSKNKFERNLRYLVTSLNNKDEKVDGLTKELIIVSLLYNSQKDASVIIKLMNKFLGLNIAEEVGGPTL